MSTAVTSPIPRDLGALAERFHLRLPASSANLGPGFDAVALALSLALSIDACRSSQYSIHATGRDIEICSSLRRNLLLERL